MVDHQIIDATAGGDRLDIVEKLAHLVDAHRVDQRYAVGALDYVGVVAHSLRQRPQTLEQRRHAVVDPGVIYITCDFLDMHVG